MMNGELRKTALACGCMLAAAGLAATVSVTEDTVVTQADVAAYTAATEINVAEGATLRFANTSAITLTASFTGAGGVVMTNAAAITLKGDSSAFAGTWGITNTGVTAANVNCFGRRPVWFSNPAGSPYGQGINAAKLYYTVAGDYNHPLYIGRGASFGVTMSSSSTNSADVYQTVGSSRLASGVYLGKIHVLATLYCSNNAQVLGGVEGTTGGALFYADGSGFKAGSKITGCSIQCANNTAAPITCLADDCFDHAKSLTMGCGYANKSAFDLTGHSQTIGALNFANPSGKTTDPGTFIRNSAATPATLTIANQSADCVNRAQFNGALSLDYSSASAKTMTFTGSATRTSTGTITVRSGSVVFDADTAWSALSGVTATGSGKAVFKTADLNPGKLELVCDDGASVEIAEDVSLMVAHAVTNGAYVAGGTYTKATLPGVITGDGTLVVIAGAPVVPTPEYVWVGGTDSDAVAADANWKGGAAPDLAAGTAVVRVSEGSNRLVLNGDAAVHSFSFNTNADFTVENADAAGALHLGEGGISVTNATGVTSPTPGLHFQTRVHLDTPFQTWDLGAKEDTTTYFEGNLSSIANGTVPFTIQGCGWCRLAGDNANLILPFVVTNVPSPGPLVIVQSNTALGSPTREVTFRGRAPRFLDGITNDVPIVISGGNGDNWNPSDTKIGFVQRGRVTVRKGIHLHISKCRFEGGLDLKEGAWFQTHLSDGVWIVNKPLTAGTGWTLDNIGHLHLAAPSNTWPSVTLNKGWIVCETNDALPEATVAYTRASQGYAYDSTLGNMYGCLDLNGFDAAITTLDCTWDSAHEYASAYGYVRSVPPATLKLTGAASGRKRIRFVNAAGLDFAGTGTFAFTNAYSTTTGGLTVESGVVAFQTGAGWTATTNVTVCGTGRIQVGAGTGAMAFGPSAGRSKAQLRLEDGGVLEIASGEQATVYALVQTGANGRDAFANMGVYGGPEAGLDAAHTLSRLAGQGTLRVLCNPRAGITLIFR